MSKLKIALVGYGHLGKWHAEKANTLEELYAIVDPLEDNRDQAASKLMLFSSSHQQSIIMKLVQRY